MLSRSVSYDPRPSTSTMAGLDRRNKPRASCPPVPSLEAPSPTSVDEHVTRLKASGEQLMQALDLWSLNKKAVWQVSATFARFSNECSMSISIFARTGADTIPLKNVPSELRRTLEQLMSQEASVDRLQQFKPSLNDIVHRFSAELCTIREPYGTRPEPPNPLAVLKSRSINASLEGFVKSVGGVREAIDVWSVKETPDDEIRTSLSQLQENFEALSCSFNERGLDLTDDVTPIFDELKKLINELISPDISSEWEDPFEDQLNSILIRLLSGLKTKQAQLAKARQDIKRRATFRLRTSAFEESSLGGPRLPSTMSRANLGRRNFTD